LQKLITIKEQAALIYWVGINANVELTDERREHIRQHHPEDFDLCMKYIESVIETPDLILEDHKNPLTAMFIRRCGAMGINVVIKLAMRSDVENRSFVVTAHVAGERSVTKLERKNKVIYKCSSGMV